MGLMKERFGILQHFGLPGTRSLLQLIRHSASAMDLSSSTTSTLEPFIHTHLRSDPLVYPRFLELLHRVT